MKPLQAKPIRPCLNAAPETANAFKPEVPKAKPMPAAPSGKAFSMLHMKPHVLRAVTSFEGQSRGIEGNPGESRGIPGNPGGNSRAIAGNRG